jgi:hypothetical protein
MKTLLLLFILLSCSSQKDIQAEFVEVTVTRIEAVRDQCFILVEAKGVEYWVEVKDTAGVRVGQTFNALIKK